MIGRKLSQYRILGRLGKGGMGEVYRAEDTRLSREVALKVLPPEIAADSRARERFEREARALAALNHPNIVTIHAVEAADGMLFITMELIQGRTLDEVISSGGLSLAKLLELAVPLADAVSTAHQRDVIHRDLKPANLMVNDAGLLKILDFGLAKLQAPYAGVDASTGPTALSKIGQVLGTLPYMSPEQAQGKPVDHRTDIFSLGVILYEMATGQRPFTGENAASLVSSILRDPPGSVTELNPALPPELDRIIGRCLEKDRARRFQSARDLRRELEGLGREPAGTSGETRRTEPASAATVAVLPFENMSPDPDNEYFSDGITEEIITKLSRMQSLQVTARTSVSRFKGARTDVKVIGRDLGVQYVLEGSVRRAGERVRITAQLIDCSTGFHVWTESYDGQLEDVFRIQEETALQIADALDLRLTPQEQQAVRRRYTENARAYDTYLRGQALIHYFEDPQKLAAGRKHFQQALELDSQYAPALAGLATVEMLTYRNFDSRAEHLRRAKELAQKAVALEPELARAHVAVGEYLAAEYDYRGAADKFREALRLETDDPWTWDVLSWVLAYQQPPDARGAEKAAREAIRLEPHFSHAYYHLGRALLLQQRYGEAIEAFEQILKLSQGTAVAYFGLSQVHLAQGDFRRALEEVGKAGSSPVIRFHVSLIHAARGDGEKCLDELERALEAGFRDFAAVDSTPHLEALRSDSRFLKLMERFRN